MSITIAAGGRVAASVGREYTLARSCAGRSLEWGLSALLGSKAGALRDQARCSSARISSGSTRRHRRIILVGDREERGVVVCPGARPRLKGRGRGRWRARHRGAWGARREPQQ
jgi:hypothetical protein